MYEKNNLIYNRKCKFCKKENRIETYVRILKFILLNTLIS